MKEDQLKISEIKGRFLQFLKIQNISIYKFSKETGIGKSNFSGKSLESELGGVQISEILNYFGGLNPDWLLLGKGEMLRKDMSFECMNDTTDMVSLEKYEKKVEECVRLKMENEALKKAASKYAEERGVYSGGMA